MRGAILLLVSVLGALAVLVSSPASAAEGGREFWWRTPAARARLGLTPPQVRRLEQIYQESLPRRRALRREVDILERSFRRMLVRGPSNDAETERLLDRLIATQKRRNVLRLVMLVRMYEELQPHQRELLSAMSRRAER